MIENFYIGDQIRPAPTTIVQQYFECQIFSDFLEINLNSL